MFLSRLYGISSFLLVFLCLHRFVVSLESSVVLRFPTRAFDDKETSLLLGIPPLVSNAVRYTAKRGLEKLRSNLDPMHKVESNSELRRILWEDVTVKASVKWDVQVLMESNVDSSQQTINFGFEDQVKRWKTGQFDSFSIGNYNSNGFICEYEEDITSRMFSSCADHAMPRRIVDDSTKYSFFPPVKIPSLPLRGPINLSIPQSRKIKKNIDSNNEDILTFHLPGEQFDAFEFLSSNSERVRRLAVKAKSDIRIGGASSLSLLQPVDLKVVTPKDIDAYFSNDDIVSARNQVSVSVNNNNNDLNIDAATVEDTLKYENRLGEVMFDGDVNVWIVSPQILASADFLRLKNNEKSEDSIVTTNRTPSLIQRRQYLDSLLTLGNTESSHRAISSSLITVDSTQQSLNHVLKHVRDSRVLSLLRAPAGTLNSGQYERETSFEYLSRLGSLLPVQRYLTAFHRGSISHDLIKDMKPIRLNSANSRAILEMKVPIEVYEPAKSKSSIWLLTATQTSETNDSVLINVEKDETKSTVSFGGGMGSGAAGNTGTSPGGLGQLGYFAPDINTATVLLNQFGARNETFASLSLAGGSLVERNVNSDSDVPDRRLLRV